MRVLITGSAGFVGSHIAERLFEEGHTVVGVDNFLTGSPDNWRWTYDVDITDRKNLYHVANETRPDLVVHCAASYSAPDMWHRDIDTNVAGTVNALLVARYHGARFFYFQTALPPVSSYAISKIAGERYINMADDVPSVIFRLANVYGPRNLSGPVPAFWRRIKADQPCTVVQTLREMVFIDDLVDAVEKVVATPDAVGKFDFCSGHAEPILRLYWAVADAMNHTKQPLLADPAPDDTVQMKLDPKPAQRMFGWRPGVSLEEGVAAAVDWYERHGVSSTYTHLRLNED